MNRKDVQTARDLAAEFVELSDELLAVKATRWDQNRAEYVKEQWAETWRIAGKLTGAHRRKSLDLTRTLAHMRRRS